MTDPYSLRFTESSRLFESLIKQPYVLQYMGMLRDIPHPDTFESSQRVSKLVIDLGFANAIESQKLRILGLAGLFHDIGKTRTPLKILMKDGPLSDEEWVDIKKHPRDGFDMFKGFKDSPLHILYETARVLVAHHE